MRSAQAQHVNAECFVVALVGSFPNWDVLNVPVFVLPFLSHLACSVLLCN